MHLRTAQNCSTQHPGDMAKSNGTRPAPTGGTAVSNDLITWSEKRIAASEAARQEIEHLRPGQAIVYHEGHLAVDAARDAAVAGRAAAFLEAATERGQGVLVQRFVRSEWYEYIFRRSR